MSRSLARDGAQRHCAVLNDIQVGQLIAEFTTVGARRPGVRLFGRDRLEEMLSPPGPIGALAAETLGPRVKPVRAILFDKAPDNNWSLGWHQDRTIAVRRKIEVEGFGAWTRKAGILHVAPPWAILMKMLTVRIHLDRVDEDNAPLIVALGSHDLGRISEDRVEAMAQSLPQMACLANAGDIWVYATAILHASDAARLPRRRRVLQVDYAADDLPGGLEWLGLGTSPADYGERQGALAPPPAVP